MCFSRSSSVVCSACIFCCCAWAISSAAFSARVREAVAFSQPTRKSCNTHFSCFYRKTSDQFVNICSPRQTNMMDQNYDRHLCDLPSRCCCAFAFTWFSRFSSFISCLILHSSASLARRLCCRLLMSDAASDFSCACLLASCRTQHQQSAQPLVPSNNQRNKSCVFFLHMADLPVFFFFFFYGSQCATMDNAGKVGETCTDITDTSLFFCKTTTTTKGPFTHENNCADRYCGANYGREQTYQCLSSKWTRRILSLHKGVHPEVHWWEECELCAFETTRNDRRLFSIPFQKLFESHQNRALSSITNKETTVYPCSRSGRPQMMAKHFWHEHEGNLPQWFFTFIFGWYLRVLISNAILCLCWKSGGICLQ